MASYEALYGRKCRSPLYWDEVGENRFLGPELVQEMKEKIGLIRKRMLTAQSRQKSYADKHRSKLEFTVGDLVYLKLRKCVHDPSQVIRHEPLNIQPNLTYEELPVQILDRKEQQLRTRTIPLVKILWRNYGIEEASWELEQQMQDKYPHLFE
ncbi:uncharacterized protein LOC133877627 [Alnus glutinosa]|uniref:uncharacterized protein LOC133877627 n=1 Tax=Alnus glutinosa TaxID=3517 RepID=UPI002D7A35A7|nr:uncharacterized protein LOC133877627 [Alnus glutinosa]